MLPPTPKSSARSTAQGWRLVDPRPISADLDRYGDFIRGSRGEFTVAKDIYVRPQQRLVQRPQRLLPRLRPPGRHHAHRLQPLLSGGRGAVRVYRPSTEALAAFAAIAADYPRHGRAARALAAEYFASDRVIAALLAGCGL